MDETPTIDAPTPPVDTSTPNRCPQEGLKPGKPLISRGVHINLGLVEKETGMDYRYLSRVLSGRREARTRTARRIAAALGMDLSEFLDAIDERRADLDAEELYSRV